MKFSISIPAINTSTSRKFENNDSLESHFESEAGSINVEYSVEEFVQLLTVNKEVTVQVLDMIKNFNCEKFISLIKSLKK